MKARFRTCYREITDQMSCRTSGGDDDEIAYFIVHFETRNLV